MAGRGAWDADEPEATRHAWFGVRGSRPGRPVLIVATLAAVVALLAGCTTTVEGKGALAESAAPTVDPTDSPTDDPTADPTVDPSLPSEPKAPYPVNSADFEVFIIQNAPGGLPQIPNGQTFNGLPTGPVTIDDTAAQFGGMDPQEALDWLNSLGYWQGYRRLWGSPTTFIYSIVDQFLINDGAEEFVESFAPSYADRLGVTAEDISDYPGCVVAAGADSENNGQPTAFASCFKKVWSIDVQAVAGTPEDAKSLAVDMAKTQYSKLP